MIIPQDLVGLRLYKDELRLAMQVAQQQYLRIEHELMRQFPTLTLQEIEAAVESEEGLANTPDADDTYEALAACVAFKMRSPPR